MATITEDYVSFETAKLLKEKGFVEDTICNYADVGGITEKWYDDYRERVLRFDWDEGYLIEPPTEPKDQYEIIGDTISAPTLQMAMKWLREVHNIIVSPYALSLGYYFEIFDLTNRDITGCKPLYKVGIPNKEGVLPTYERACEAAIKYCLENLI